MHLSPNLSECTMSNPNLIAAIELAPTFDQVERQASENLRQLSNESNLTELKMEFLHALQLPIAAKGRMTRALKIADKISAEVTPYSACRNGCSYCCHTSVAVSVLEAQMIGDAIGKAPLKAPARMSREEIGHYHRQPCPFLNQGQCSIYEARPMACRIMFNMSDSSHYCNTDIDPEDSRVTQLNLQDLEFTFTGVFMSSGFADIRDFFPDGAGRRGKSKRRKG